MKLRALWEIFIDALYPKAVSCPVCSRCARLDRHGVCGDCAPLLESAAKPDTPAYIDGAAAGLLYNGSARRLVHRFKYEGERHLADTLASYIELDEGWSGVIHPVPMHPQKLKKRGYNQSELLAKALCQRLGMRLSTDLVRRVKQSGTQTAMTAKQRRENVKGAFRAREMSNVDVILVDDVLTTGSTASECARALKEAGAGRVYLAAACVAARREADAQDMV